jgi:methionyl-tRNA formyltransferase
MKIVFFGTPEFAVPSLEKILQNAYEVSAVVTAPDKPGGRGQMILTSPIKKFAIQNSIPVLQPQNLKDQTFISELRKIGPDLLVVVAYRILPPEVFTIPKTGAFNLHASLLPKYRGAAPINWAIIRGEKETGVTTFFLEEKVDTGNIIIQARCPINEDETAGELHDKLAELGSAIVLHTIGLIRLGKVKPIPQDNNLASSAPKLTKETGLIDWSADVKTVHNLVRGLSPVPAAYTFLGDKLLKIYRTKTGHEKISEKPGTIMKADSELHVATGNGVMKILELQKEGKKRMDAASFLRGVKLIPGQQLHSKKDSQARHDRSE